MEVELEEERTIRRSRSRSMLLDDIMQLEANKAVQLETQSIDAETADEHAQTLILLQQQVQEIQDEMRSGFKRLEAMMEKLVQSPPTTPGTASLETKTDEEMRRAERTASTEMSQPAYDTFRHTSSDGAAKESSSKGPPHVVHEEPEKPHLILRQPSARTIKVYPTMTTMSNRSTRFDHDFPSHGGPSLGISQDLASDSSSHIKPSVSAAATMKDLRRLSLEHGWQHPNSEHFIRQIQLDEIIENSPSIRNLRRQSLSKQLNLRTCHHTAVHSSKTKSRLSFHHESKKRVLWDGFVMVFVLFNMIVTPLVISFGVESRLIDAVDILQRFVYTADLGINLLTTFTINQNTIVISSPRQTALHYMSSRWVVFDLLSCVPWADILPNRTTGRFLGMAKCIRLLQFPGLAARVLPLRVSGILRIFGLFGIVILVSHTNACYWNWIAKDWKSQNPSYNEASPIWRYAHCWCTMILAINSSPPSTYSMKEEVTISVYALLGNLIQATVFGSVAHLISSFNEQDDEYHRKLKFTHDRCRFLGIRDSLAKRIQAYYEHLYRETKSITSNADAFIEDLSPALVSDVKYQLYRDMLKQIPFLSSPRIDNSVVELLVLHLTIVIFMKDDVVVRRGESGDWIGFIGAKGSVAVLEANQLTYRIRRVLQKGEYFGEMALFHQARRENTIVALSWVQIHQLHRRDLDSVKEKYPDQGKVLEEETSIRKQRTSFDTERVDHTITVT